MAFLLLFTYLSLSLDANTRHEGQGSTSNGSSLGMSDTLMSALSVSAITPGGGRPLSTPIVCRTGSSVMFARNKCTRLCNSNGIGCRGVRLASTIVAVGVSDDAICTHNIPSSTNIRGNAPIFGSNRAPCRSGVVHCGFGSGGKFVGGVIARRKRKCIADRRSGGNTGSRLCLHRKQCAAYSGRRRPRFCLGLSVTGIHPGGGIIFNPTRLIIRSIPLPVTVPFKFFPFGDDCSSKFVVPACNSRVGHNFCLHSKKCCFTVDSHVSLGILNRVFAGNS